MDIQRPDRSKEKRRRRILLISVIGVAVVLVTIGLSRLEPAAPTVERGLIWTDTVKRGPMTREVRGLGVLVPEEIRWVTASNSGRIERILLLPGEIVQADTVLIELSNPELVQSAFDAASQVDAAIAKRERLRITLEVERLTQESTVASIKAQLTQAQIEADADDELFKDGLVAAMAVKRSRANANELAARLALEIKRLEISARSAETQLGMENAEIERLRQVHALKQRQVDALKVRSGIDGVLQRLGDEQRSLQPGQQMGAGSTVAQIANPTKLKAEIRIPETQARDIQHGQAASIDTRNGIISGRVSRIDPAVQNGTVTVDIALEGDLPRGARPDLSVDGTITLERLDDVLYVGRPASAQSGAQTSLFRISADGTASRIQVQLGRSSVNSIEVVRGLEAGDEIILSDTSPWDGHDRLRLN